MLTYVTILWKVEVIQSALVYVSQVHSMPGLLHECLNHQFPPSFALLQYHTPFRLWKILQYSQKMHVEEGSKCVGTENDTASRMP